ncbi:hypothetical protein NW752_007821 [Fusarium irregulare]|uniref:Stc1 domain-containing protein n=1 Tax=Fusarium irregulare TaxID=2494466 RepID=A0A9W8U6Q3_9HYPO|nr:hypothetical protein NW766_009878 [Fusarium irregulare]KAJ4013519.1 hypothetical protein NW752_007821 [Fusarium irregulare]
MAGNRNNQYRCAVGGEWKDISEFSRSQQRRARPNNRENSGMICLAHSQPSRAEITCTVCCRTRPIDQYSNNERKSDNPRCQQCVAWDTDQEHGVTPIPLATGHVSIEEDALKRYKEPTSCSEFFTHEIPAAPITGPEALGLRSSESTNRAFAQVVGSSSSARVASETSSVVNETMSVTSSRVTTTFPPHLRARMEKSALEGKSASEENSKSAATTSSQSVKMLPPHLRKSKLEQSSEADSVSTATTMRKEKEETATSKKILYNAWDSKGVQHRVTKDPTVASSSASVSAASTSGETESLGRGNSKWPKASEASDQKLDYELID